MSDYTERLELSHREKAASQGSMAKAIERQEMHRYLDELRESGSINMLGAPRELGREFGLDPSRAKQVFWDWANCKDKP